MIDDFLQFLDVYISQWLFAINESPLYSQVSFDCEKQPPEVFCKKGVLRNFVKFTEKQLSQSIFFNKVGRLRPATLLIKTLAQVFSCEFCEISKNTFS